MGVKSGVQDEIWPGLAILSCIVFSCLVRFCVALPCLVSYCLAPPFLRSSALSRLLLSCLALPCLLLSFLVLLYTVSLVLSCLVLSCLVLSRLAFGGSFSIAYEACSFREESSSRISFACAIESLGNLNQKLLSEVGSNCLCLRRAQ